MPRDDVEWRQNPVPAEVRAIGKFSRMNIFFLHDPRGSLCSVVEPESHLIRRIEMETERLAKADVNIYLGDEYLDPRMGRYDGRKLRAFIESREIETYLFAKRYLFTPDAIIELGKEGRTHIGDGNAGFRICDTINRFPLGEPENYFVTAINLGLRNIPQGKNVYINDRIRGARTIIGGEDSGWLGEETGRIRERDTERTKYRIITLQ